MSTFLYVEADSPVHRLHPVTRIVGLLLLFVPPMAFNDPRWVAPTMGLALAVLYLARSGQNLVRMWKFCLVIFLASAAMWALFLKDDRPHVEKALEPFLVEQWPVAISVNTIGFGLAMGARILAFLIAGLAFIGTTKPEELTAGLRALRLPQGLCLAISLSFRLVPTFAATGATVAQAQMARGLDVTSGSLWQRLRKYVPLLTPVLAYALRNADSLSMALESKGWASHRPRSQYLHFTTTSADLVALVLLAAIATGSIVLRLSGYGELLPRL